MPGTENLPDPPELTKGQKNELRDMIELFGEHIAACLVCKVWSVREAAVKKIIKDLPGVVIKLEDAGATIDMLQSDLFLPVCSLLENFAAEKVTAVFLKAIEFLKAILKAMPECGIKVPVARYSNHLRAFTRAIIKLGDNNGRVREESSKALDILCLDEALVPHSLFHCCWRYPRRLESMALEAAAAAAVVAVLIAACMAG